MTSKLKVSEIFGPTIQGEGAQIGRPTVFVRLGGCDYRCSWCDSLHAVLPEHRHTWKTMEAAEVVAEVNRLAGHIAVLITLSGGNPALQNGCEEFIRLAHLEGHTVTMETQGSIRHPWMRTLDHLCLSPKPPSSGMTTDWGQLVQLLNVQHVTDTDLAQMTKQERMDAEANSEYDGFKYRPMDTIMKVVVFDDIDFEFAREARTFCHRWHIPLFLQVGNHDVRAGIDKVEGAPFYNMTAEAMLQGELMDKLRWLTEKLLENCWYDVRVLPQLHVLMYGNKQAV